MSDSSSLELRQLTVMFCDLVDSTSLSLKLDDETWREFIDEFQSTCERIFSAHGGYIHEYGGDGPLVYFGYPTPYEDCAFRAVSAGLELIQHFTDLSSNIETSAFPSLEYVPQVRIGIHTGPVVTGYMRGKPTATGSMVALAERIQREAPPNQLIISRDTLDLVKTRFVVEPLGVRQLKGFEEGKECFLVQGEDELTPDVTPFTGRATELELLKKSWLELKPRVGGRFFLVSGEAGVGKTRLVNEFRSGIDSTENRIIKWQCSPYFNNSAFYPLIRAIKKSIEHLSQKQSIAPYVVELLADHLPDDAKEEVGSVVEVLLGIHEEQAYPEISGTPEFKRNLIQTALLDWAVKISQKYRLLIIVEDVNWIDPSTKTLLGRMAEREDMGQLMVVLTQRTLEKSMWEVPFPIEKIALQGLSNSEAKLMLDRIAKNQGVTCTDIDSLLVRADGVPLYIEELSKMIFSMRHQQDMNMAEPIFAPDDDENQTVPNSIRDLLAVRLSSLGAAKSVAQTAAAIGREFPFELLMMVTQSSKDQLNADLQSIEKTGLLIKRKSGLGSQYTFKHALVADAAYGSMLSSRRIDIHEKIAFAIESQTNCDIVYPPELIAYHFSKAKNNLKAVIYWQEAGRKAKRNSAQAEAISHYEKARSLLDELDELSEDEILKMRLSILLALAACYDAVDGYSAEPAGKAYKQAEEIALKLKDEEKLLLARFGLSGYFMMRGDFNRAYELSQMCFDAIQTACADDIEEVNSQNVMAQAQASFSLGCVLFHRAEFADSMLHMQRCYELCTSIDPQRRRLRHDPFVMCLVYQAWYKWEEGFPDQSLKMVKHAVATASKSQQLFSKGVALAFQAAIHLFRGEFHQAIDLASQAVDVCEEPGFSTWLAWAKVLRGRATTEFELERGLGIDEIVQGLNLWDMSGAIVTRPFAVTLLAEAYRLTGEHDLAMKFIKQAVQMVDEFGERYYYPEIMRVYGRLLMDSVSKHSAINHAETYSLSTISYKELNEAQRQTLDSAFNILQEGAAFSRRKKMRSSFLRISTDLALLHWLRDEPQVAINIQDEALNSFSEGYETASYKRAAAQRNTMKEEMKSTINTDVLPVTEGRR